MVPQTRGSLENSAHQMNRWQKSHLYLWGELGDSAWVEKSIDGKKLIILKNVLDLMV